jgi:hypothetical protein
MILRRTAVGGVFAALTFLFVYGNAVFFSNAVPESHFLGWAAGQGVRVLNMPGESLRQHTVSEEDLWNQGHNAKSRYWIGTGIVLFLAIGLAAGAALHLLLSRMRKPPSGSAAGAPGPGAGAGAAAEARPGRLPPLALASLIVALLGGVAFGQILGYGAVILGWAALAEMKHCPSPRGRWLAWAGILLGAAVLAVWAVTLQIQPPLHAFE